MLSLFFFLEENKGAELTILEFSEAWVSSFTPPHPTEERRSVPAPEVCVFLCHFHGHQAQGLEGSCQLIFVAMVTRVPVELVVHKKCPNLFLTG